MYDDDGHALEAFARACRRLGGRGEASARRAEAWGCVPHTHLEHLAAEIGGNAGAYATIKVVWRHAPNREDGEQYHRIASVVGGRHDGCTR